MSVSKIKVGDWLPEHIYTSDLLTTSGIGAGIGALTALILNRRRHKKAKIRKALLGALYGGLIGAGANIAYQKIKENLGGRYTGKRHALPDITGKQETNVYIMPADDKPMAFSEERAKNNKNTAFFGWDEKADAIDYINSLPDNVSVNLSGYSYGGDSAYDIAAATGKRVKSLRLLDPVGTRGWLSYLFGLPIKKPSKHIKDYTVELAGLAPTKKEALIRSNMWARTGRQYPAANIKGADVVIYPNDSHRLESTTYKL